MLTNEDGSVKLEILSHQMIPDVHIFKVRTFGDITDEDLLTACDNRSLTDRTIRHCGGFVKDYNTYKEVHVFFN